MVRTLRLRRPNPVFSAEYEVIRRALRHARRSAGMSQRELAGRLGKSSSHVVMIEQGQRKVDSLELFRMASCLCDQPVEFFAQIERELRELLDSAEGQDGAAP